jgi:CheY-like chemotaxis protein
MTKTYEIFYAENTEAERLLFREAFNDLPEAVNITIANDGIDAVSVLSIPNYHPDLIFLDLLMPFIDGIECLREIRLDKKFDDVPVIMFSISSYEKDIKTAYEAGATLYILKPFNVTHQAALMKKMFVINWQEYLPKPPLEKFLFKT